jgi:restriction endonuclease Mrr
MVYTLDWDVEKEKFFMEGDRAFLEQTPYSEIPDKVNTIADILRVFTEQKEQPVDEQAAHQFSRLVTILRISKREEIERVHEAFYTRQYNDFDGEQQKKIRDIWTDALALAGTKATVSHLISKVRSQEIPTIRAALAIKNLINIRVVSKEMIHELLVRVCCHLNNCTSTLPPPEQPPSFSR